MLLFELLKELLKYKTITGSIEENNKCIEFIKEYLVKNHKGIFSKEIERNKVKSILFTNKEDTFDLDILELVHIDIVPAEENMFIPKQEGKNILKGRGTADMKGFVACSIKLFEYILENNFNIKYGLLIVSDEETGGINGTKCWTEEFNLKSKILLDPDTGGNLNKIIYKVKGSCFMTLKSKGLSCHGSRPWLGEDAIESLMNTIIKIRQKFPYFSVKNEPGDKWVNTFHVGTINGGKALNTVADEAEAKLDFRFIEGYSCDSIMKFVKECCDENVTAEFNDKGNLIFCDYNDKFIQMYKNIIHEYTNEEVTLDFATGTSDSKFFASVKDIVIIGHQSDCGDLHGKDEWIDITKLEVFYNIRKKFVKEAINILLS